MNLKSILAQLTHLNPLAASAPAKPVQPISQAIACEEVYTVDDLTISLLVFDRSSSMTKMRRAAEHGLRTLVKDVQASDGADHVALGIIVFDGESDFALPLTMAKNVDPKTLHYRTGIGTKLYGTVCEAIHYLLKINQSRSISGLQPLKVVLTVFTDGADGRSQNMLIRCNEFAGIARRHHWTLDLIGFGTDGVRIAQKMGFVDRDGRSTGISVLANASSLDDTFDGVVIRTSHTATGARRTHSVTPAHTPT